MTTEVRPVGGSSTSNSLARWTLGMAVTGIRYIFQRVPLYRRANAIEDTDPSLPDFERAFPGDPGTLQRADDGQGPLFHRQYTIFVTDERLDAEALIDHILENPNRVAPSRMARFETFEGGMARSLGFGDELVVRLPGPWDGPVRVVERTPTSFRLATLKGHLEAGRSSSRPATTIVDSCASASNRGLAAETRCSSGCTRRSRSAVSCNCTCGRSSAGGSPRPAAAP